MNTLKQTSTFVRWLSGLKDQRAKIAIARRIQRATTGNLGDVKPVGDGVSEMRIPIGQGYRVYFIQRGDTIIILLCGGSKKRQQADIQKAKAMAKEY